MTMRNRMKTEYIAIAFGLLGCTGHQPTYEYIFEAEPVDLQVKQIEGGYEVEGTSAGALHLGRLGEQSRRWKVLHDLLRTRNRSTSLQQRLGIRL